MERKTQLLLMILINCLLFISCKKENNIGDPNDPNDTSHFDLQNPEGYLIYLKNANSDGTHHGSLLMEFKPGKKMWYYDIGKAPNPSIYSYEIIDDNTISINNINFVFQEGKLISVGSTAYIAYSLLKKPSKNLLSRKSFQGTYYQNNGNGYFPKYFYSYDLSENKVHAGVNPAAQGNTYNYVPLCGIAAYAQYNNSTYKEFMVLINGKLETNMQYPDGAEIEIAYGTFTEFKLQ